MKAPGKQKVTIQNSGLAKIGTKEDRQGEVS